MNSIIKKAVRAFFALWVLFFSMLAQADENFVPGIYQDSNGRQFLLSGANESTGRKVCTLKSLYNIDAYFNAVWETGPAIGNSILAGSPNIVNNPNGYQSGRSYGVIGQNNFSSNWNAGGFLAASQLGNTLSVASLSLSGTTSASFSLTLLSQGAAIAASSDSFVPGVYRDSNGDSYQLSGAPSQTGRTVWTLTAMEGSSSVFNAIWETGAALGNSIIGMSSSINSSPLGFAASRSYGAIGTNSGWNWSTSDYLAAVQAGNTIAVSDINIYSNNTRDVRVLIKDTSVTSTIGTSSENFVPAYYRDSSGHRYLVSGSAEDAGRSRTVWSIASVGNPVTFSGIWESGAAAGNNIIGMSSSITSAGYAAGRSYGAIGTNSWSGWSTNYTLAAVQAGNTIALSSLNCIYNGCSTQDVRVLTQGVGGIGGAGSAQFSSASYYVNKLDGKAVIGVERTGGGTGQASVTYSTSDGTASGTDYTAAQGGVLAWADKDTAIKYINVTIPKTARGNTSFNLTLSNPVTMAVGPQSTATVTIFDNLQDVVSKPSVDRIMNWAEYTYPQYFPHDSIIITQAITVGSTPYTYRFYPTTGIYLGSDGTSMVLYGGPWSNLNTVGTVSNFLPGAATAGF